jgi:hypothetical protein
MYRTKEMYGPDHSTIFSTQVNNTLYGTHMSGVATHGTVSTIQASYGKDAVSNTT